MPSAVTAAVELDDSAAFQGLTAKQYQLTQAIFSGLSNVDAYRRTYDCSGMSDATIARAASRAANEPLVREKLIRMRQAVDEKTTLLPVASKSFVVERLVHLSLNATKESVQLGAVTQLGKVAGIDAFRETTRVEHVTRTPEDVDRELKDLIRSTAQTIEGAAKDVTKPLEPGKRRRSPRA